ncbi:hypothetical protein [Aestuariicoccus sp. MJ-SS9]|uniref:hypothetical protein n=1 Tax=Aestuariicoccus sp. MJ-SS9 TaxID=3079855 RepID=UPI00290C578E|nr:hypothetical protein [Aestuariicoccus sp. MJ-SS9]MDU8910669.1 hypothetical protein [Aestuariicoccus sp. MJ-SS9]
MFYERPQHIDRWRAFFFAEKVLAELADPLVIDMCHVWMRQGRRLIGIRQQLSQFGFVLQLERREALKNGLDHLVQLTINPFKLSLPSYQIRATLDPKAVHLARELQTELVEELRLHQVFAQAVGSCPQGPSDRARPS